MATYLTLDKDQRALNIVEWGGTTIWQLKDDEAAFVQYDGPWWPGALWDGKKLIDPNPPEQSASTAEAIPSKNGGPNVIA